MDKSPVTGLGCVKAFVKHGVQYYSDHLGNIFCEELDQSNKVGGGNEVERNSDELNAGRLERIRMLTGKDAPKVLDYGCGHGWMAEYFNNRGVPCNPYDKYVEGTELTYENDCVVLTEVVEHLTAPFEELAEVYSVLRDGGVVMIETSFSDWLTKDDAYITPTVGHSTIFSHAGLDFLMQKFGFKIGNHINRNVRIYIK
jgi:2-polyprenyl-3-methyl-5-hydroxy-6-metoxy-1,4-benzoquinol methylase